MTITSILTNYEFVFYGISILIVILLIFASVKFMFMLPSKGKQKYYKVAYFIMVALLIAYISLIFYETSTKAFSIIKIMDYLFPFIIIAYLAYYFRKRSKEKIKKVKIGKNSEKKLKFNPVSKTYFKAEGDRLQHYNQDLYKCNSCGHKYHPKVHSGTYKEQFKGIITGLLLFFIPFFLGWITNNYWVTFITYGALMIFAAIYFVYYALIKKRKEVSSKSKKIKYGNIILECPKCKSTKAKMIK
ncbi:hypothetical protein HOC35_02410 [Candidatus Woesearchaeota archaeon]|jgi:hypothetical protein|nr:hypothetical protein [Candidatus Woesearchaeota archaeon]